jgi:outer membrane protein assembly factor BamE
MAQTRSPLYTLTRAAVIALACTALCACIYRINIQQGNLLEQERVEQVEVGMTRSAVQFLLGTPLVNDPFHADRWDYPYYLKRGRSNDIERSWLVVWFDNDVVSRIERDRDLNVEPSS